MSVERDRQPRSPSAERASPGQAGFSDELADPALRETLWWAKSKGGSGNGVPLNDHLPINPTPLVGGQSWFDNVVVVRKV